MGTKERRHWATGGAELDPKQAHKMANCRNFRDMNVRTREGLDSSVYCQSTLDPFGKYGLPISTVVPRRKAGGVLA
jgi:hypothetical protein